MPKTIKKKSNISITLDNDLLRLIKKRRIYLSRLVNELLWKQLATSQIPYSQFPIPQGSSVERYIGNVEVPGSTPGSSFIFGINFFRFFQLFLFLG